MKVLALSLLPLFLASACASSQEEAVLNKSVQPPGQAQGSKGHFRYQLETSASPEAIWDVWMDVAGWKNWDLGLEDARSGPLGLHVEGTVVPRSGPEAKFVVTEFDETKHTYAFQNNLPGGRLTVRRTVVSTSPTVIEHEVEFSGLTGWLFAQLLGGGFRQALPPTMHKLAAIAEGTS